MARSGLLVRLEAPSKGTLDAARRWNPVAPAGSRVPGPVAGQSGQRHRDHRPGRRRGLADDHARGHCRHGGPGPDRNLRAGPAVRPPRRHAGRSLGPANGPAPGAALDGADVVRPRLAEQPRSRDAGHPPVVHLPDRRRRGADRPRLAGERARDCAAGRACRRGHAQRRRHELRPRGRTGRRRRRRRRGRGRRRLLPERRVHASARRRPPVVAARGASG